ncbi:MAG: hypothetical protein KGR98_08525 [Verrucomicrobia bacterium]|nr:hypothetical protein [Verrucomicrobiota bacterium]
MELLVVNRLCDPRSEWFIHERWFFTFQRQLQRSFRFPKPDESAAAAIAARASFCF